MVVLLQALLNCTGAVPGVTRDGICLEHGICKTPKVISEVLCKFFNTCNDGPASILLTSG